MQNSKEHQNQGNVTPKDHNNHSVTEPRDKETCNLPKKEFKIAVLRKLSELRENTERQFNEIRYICGIYRQWNII